MNPFSKRIHQIKNTGLDCRKKSDIHIRFWIHWKEHSLKSVFYSVFLCVFVCLFVLFFILCADFVSGLIVVILARHVCCCCCCFVGGGSAGWREEWGEFLDLESKDESELSFPDILNWQAFQSSGDLMKKSQTVICTPNTQVEYIFKTVFCYQITLNFRYYILRPLGPGL